MDNQRLFISTVMMQEVQKQHNMVEQDVQE